MRRTNELEDDLIALIDQVVRLAVERGKAFWPLLSELGGRMMVGSMDQNKSLIGAARALRIDRLTLREGLKGGWGCQRSMGGRRIREVSDGPESG